MNGRIGTCSLCGGDVMGHSGPWHGVVPPPPPRCARCGAVAATDVIKMHPRPWWKRAWPSMILAAAILAAAPGCSTGNSDMRYTVTSADGTVYRGAKRLYVGSVYVRWQLPDGRQVITSGNFTAVQECECERTEEGRTRT